MQCLRRHFRIAADSQAKMLRQVKIPSRNNAGLILFLQQPIELIDFAGAQPGTDDGAILGLVVLQVAAELEKSVENWAVALQNPLGPRRRTIEIVERDYAQAFRRMGSIHPVKIVDVPHALGQFRSRKY